MSLTLKELIDYHNGKITKLTERLTIARTESDRKRFRDAREVLKQTVAALIELNSQKSQRRLFDEDKSRKTFRRPE